MEEYHQNLREVTLGPGRKRELDSPLNDFERRQLRAILGSLQWLVAQLRLDMAFIVSSLQSAEPAVRTLVKANGAVGAFRENCDFELIFRAVDYTRGGLMVVSDAALGNVQLNGSNEGEPIAKVYSQACYFVVIADEELMSGRTGRFNVLESRSHRILRVCRSSYAAELLGKEALDVGILCRGFAAAVRDFEVVGKHSDYSIDKVPLTVVVDAKDVHDKGSSDTSSYGTQKSLAFTVAWLRASLRRANTSLRWTATENMFADGGTKEMDLTHLRGILHKAEWSVTYSPKFVKQVQKAARKPAALNSSSATTTALPGEALPGDDPLLSHLLKLSEYRGWHALADMGINVLYRTPEPRFASEALPFRTTFGCFEVSGQLFWRVLERGLGYQWLIRL